MEIKEAIQVLKDHNLWRKGKDETIQMTNPKKLGIAIDTVVNEFENLFISGVSDSSMDFIRYNTEDLKNAYRKGEKGKTYHLKGRGVILPSSYEDVNGC
ncbi:hypothetical protein I5168_11990 [Nonlabens sp. SCSIO 43208]|uniref:hypothetical protein n=1 Tax=Nonlabens sp. SCSIO 43208 TaxID=2793009 RepID=UPI003D6B783D